MKVKRKINGSLPPRIKDNIYKIFIFNHFNIANVLDIEPYKLLKPIET